ncbi:CRISPR-associated helicase Cas3', partial [uncultured Lactobacillus sp.]|uniref:CRISPR-associated helicase Cas3' n=1 Tax=uncultured Lactobacillus sp. TaxID=153152 RepID=UPI002630CE6D
DYGEVVVNSWFSGKKSSLSHFAVGTIDNLLLLGLKQKHLFLRHLGFSDKVVIIDEVHAYDVYMSSYLKKALQWLGAYHVPVIALSATLPIDKRNELLKAYLKGKYNSKIVTGPANWQKNKAYPLLSMLDGQGIKQVTDFEIPQDERRKVEIIRFKGNEQDIVNKALSEISNGGVAGIIVNTVKRAQAIAQLLPNDVETLVLHSEFLAPERERLENRLQKAIGKNAKRPSKMVVIGTQVLEQSLDIDFDVLFTDIAPIDLIIQRIGRLHRHNINRPKDLEKPKAYITSINDFGDYGDGNKFIYGNYLLMKTDHFLKDSIEIPQDVSTLVQDVYDENNDDSIDGIQDAKDDFVNKVNKLKEKAKQFQIKKPLFKHPVSLSGWLNDSQINVENDNHAAACVRDIEETIELVLLKHTADGNCLLDGRMLENVSSEEIASQTIRLPIAVSNNLNKRIPDKIGESINKLEKIRLENYPNWSKDIWLHGVLALTLNEQDEVSFNGYRLHYSESLGLMYEKEDADA